MILVPHTAHHLHSREPRRPILPAAPRFMAGYSSSFRL